MSLRNSFAVSMNLSYLTAALITPLRLRPSHASDRCLIFKDANRRKNTTMGLLVSDCAGTSRRAEGLCRQRAGLRLLWRVLRSLAMILRYSLSVKDSV